jgi:outer membrane translocation and assembly module TamA
VEGLSVGARGIVRHPLGTAQATVRLGTADLTPNAELAATHPRWGRTLSASLYHQLAAVDPAAMSMGSSAAALLFGRDAGEYYRATGARFDVTPAATERPWYRWSLFAERQRPVERGTVWSAARLLGSDRDFRPNLDADPADLVGASLSLTPWWGSDPLAPQAGLEYYLEGATGDREFSRSRLVARTLLPVGTRHRIGLEAGAGTSWGDLPAQANWFLGGSETLRGYDPSTLVGSSFLRGRAGITQANTAFGLTLFGDAGWAGDRSAFDADDLLFSAGAGATVLDGLLRFDVSRALREPTGWKLDLYLDGII